MAAVEGIDPTGWLDDQLAAASPDLLRSMVKTFAEAVMSAEADQLCGAEYGQRSPALAEISSALVRCCTR